MSPTAIDGIIATVKRRVADGLGVRRNQLPDEITASVTQEVQRMVQENVALIAREESVRQVRVQLRNVDVPATIADRLVDGNRRSRASP